MNLPNIIMRFLQAHSSQDSESYVACFASNASVLDEGKTYQGRTEIREWPDKTNKKYNLQAVSVIL